jgi:hypothetical protein
VQPSPSALEWLAAAVGAAAIVAVGGQLLLGRVDAGVTRWSRITGSLVASLATAVLLVAAVLAGAGIQASRLDRASDGADRPASGFARALIDVDPDVTERVALFGVGLLVPLAAVLVVLALAAVDPARTLGLRVVVALACSALAVVGLAVAFGDTGTLAALAAVSVGVLALAALGALAADEIGTPRRLQQAADDQAAGESAPVDAASSAWRA